MNSTIDLCKIPAGKSPDGKYNFIDPPSLGPAVIAVGTTLLVLSTAFTTGRLFMNRNKLHSADYITFFACLVNIAFTGVIIAEHESFRHSWDIPVCWYTGTFFKLPFIQTVLFSPAFFFSKASIFLLYRQLFGTGKRFRIAINIGLVVTFFLYMSNIPLAAVYSAPDPGQPWSSLLVKLQSKGQRFSLAGLIQSAIGTVMDLYIFFLPMPILFGLHMPLRRRVQLVGVFSTALLGVAASVVSIYFKALLLSSHDLSWLGAQASLCSLIETNIALIVGCMPACAQLLSPGGGASNFFKSLRSRILGSRRANTSAGSGIGKSVPSKTSVASDQQEQKPGSFGAARYDATEMHDYQMSDTRPLNNNIHVEQNEEAEWHLQPKSSVERRTTHQLV